MYASSLYYLETVPVWYLSVNPVQTHGVTHGYCRNVDTKA